MDPIGRFGIQVGAIGPASVASGGKNSNLTANIATLSSPRAIGTTLDAPHKFEAYLVQSMIENMLPKNADSTFGSGFSGDAWRSMMAERIADIVAAHGGLGVAARLLGKTQIRGDQK